MKINEFLILMLLLGFVSCAKRRQEQVISVNYGIAGVPFNEVQLSDKFWFSKLETNRKVTIPVSFKKCQEMGRMDNFLIAGGVMKGKTKGEMPFDDSDVYKIIEGASYSLTTSPDSALEKYLDSIINIIKIGQEDDGYLTTWKTIDPTVSPATWCEPGARWENLSMSHELYNSGHLFEAAAAHYRSTGKTNLLDIAIKNADLLVKVFGASKNTSVPGHQIVETGLIKLYMINHKQAYLDLARHFLDTRGDSTKREIWGAYSQDHKPVVEQDEAVGHAVRALYMYAGMTDIASLYNDENYRNAVDKIWENMVNKKMYLTGGIGARHDGEAFGENYELPNLTAYNETCAAIANVYWNYRMFLLHGDSKYIDVLERSLYNGVISGVGIDGKTFFYSNPLECDDEYGFNRGNTLTRQAWFDCSCCPTNLCRFMPSVPGYIYAVTNSKLYLNLFIQSSSTVKIGGTSVAISQETNYPWSGDVKISVNPERKENFTLCLRIPGWAENKPVPGDLYHYIDEVNNTISVKVNGECSSVINEKGYVVLNREWKKGDVIEYSIPMEIRKVKANQLVEEDRGKIALERGPLVYCVEEIDNSNIDRIKVSDNTEMKSNFNSVLFDGIQVVTSVTGDKETALSAIPYFVWNNRGETKMKVWLPER